jgi:hypothetical protein
LTCFVWINCFTSPDDTIEDRRPGKQHVSLNLNNGPSPPGQTRRPDREPRKIDLYRISSFAAPCGHAAARDDVQHCAHGSTSGHARGSTEQRQPLEQSATAPMHLLEDRWRRRRSTRSLSLKKTRSFHVQHTRDNTTVRFHNPRKSGAKYTCTLISLYISRVANPCTTR